MSSTLCPPRDDASGPRSCSGFRMPRGARSPSRGSWNFQPYPGLHPHGAVTLTCEHSVLSEFKIKSPNPPPLLPSAWYRHEVDLGIGEVASFEWHWENSLSQWHLLGSLGGPYLLVQRKQSPGCCVQVRSACLGGPVAKDSRVMGSSPRKWHVGKSLRQSRLGRDMAPFCSFFLPLAWKLGSMARAPAAVSHHELTSRMDAILGRWENEADK